MIQQGLVEQDRAGLDECLDLLHGIYAAPIVVFVLRFVLQISALFLFTHSIPMMALDQPHLDAKTELLVVPLLLNRGDLAGRLAATQNNSLKGRALHSSTIFVGPGFPSAGPLTAPARPADEERTAHDRET